MDMTVYLPEALATEARKYEIKYSRLFQKAIVNEMLVQDMMKKDHEAVVLPVEDENGHQYYWEFVGKQLAMGETGDIYYHEGDDAFIVYDIENERCHVYDCIEDAEGLIQKHLNREQYVGLMNRLGHRPVVKM